MWLQACTYMFMNSLTHLQVFPSHGQNNYSSLKKHKSSGSAADHYPSHCHLSEEISTNGWSNESFKQDSNQERRTMMWNKLLIVGTCLVLSCSLELSAACTDYGSQLCIYIASTSGSVGHGWTCSNYGESITTVSYVQWNLCSWTKTLWGQYTFSCFVPYREVDMSCSAVLNVWKLYSCRE